MRRRESGDEERGWIIEQKTVLSNRVILLEEDEYLMRGKSSLIALLFS